MKKRVMTAVLAGMVLVTTPIFVLAAESAYEPILWSGMTCAMFGDSITWYDGNQAMGGDYDIQKGFPSYLEECFGIRSDNLAYSGACLVSHPESEYTDVYDKVMETDTSAYDLVVIDAGATDYKYFPSPIGEIAEEAEGGAYDLSTFCGAYQAIIEKIQGENPDVILVLFTPISERGDDAANDLGLYLTDYIDAVHAVGDYYGIPVLDLYNLEVFNRENLEPLTLDGIHPNNAGYEAICQSAVIPFFAKLGLKGVRIYVEESTMRE